MTSSDRLKSDRELIAAILDPYYWTDEFDPANPQTDDFDRYLWSKRTESLIKADAVLAALGDRLLPVIPDTWDRIGMERTAEGGWAARLTDQDFTRHTSKECGITPAAAIRAALEPQP